MTDPGAQAPATRRDRLKQLRAFCEAVRSGSLSGAARAIESSQPAVSTHVQTLEAELGAVLLRRQGAGVVPTRVGANLYRIALPLVEGLLRLPALFEERHHGVAPERLRIGTGVISGWRVLLDIMQRFHARNPRTRVEVQTDSGLRNITRLRGFELDLIVVALDTVPPDIEFRPLVVSEPVLITPEGHPLSERGRIDFTALSDQALIAPRSGGYIRQFQDAVLRLRGVRPRIVLEVDGWGTMVNYVAAGVGCAIVPDLAVAHEPVRAVRFVRPYGSRTYGVAVRRDRFMGLAAERFLQVAVSGADDGDDAQ